jgi:hypothetical protein
LEPLFSDALQVLNLSENHLKGFITDGFNENVQLKSLVSFNVSGNKKLKGDCCEYIGKAPKLTDFNVARTKLFGTLKGENS